MKWDIFISYATEDKIGIAQPLAHSLRNMGYKVWFDDFELTVGDSLHDKIDKGISNSSFGIVILSHNFFAKKWTRLELDGLVQKGISGKKVLLPIWHNITHADVLKRSPILAGKLAIDSQSGINTVVAEINKAIINSKSKMKLFSLYDFVIINNEIDIDIIDTKGELVCNSKKRKIKILKQDLQYIKDEYYSDGDIIDFSVSKGRIKKESKTLANTSIEVELDRIYNFGDEVDYEIKCKYINSFTQNEEYWIAYEAIPNMKSTFTIHFPIDRPYKTFYSKTKTGVNEKIMSLQPIELVIDERKCLKLTVLSPKLENNYIIGWTW